MAPWTHKRSDRQLGITLIELLVSMIILSIVTTMLVMGWVNMQRATAFTVQNNNARADARDALSRMAVELRGAQPVALQTATPTPSPTWPVFTVAQPTETQFYSAFNVTGATPASSDGTGVAALRLTRFYLNSGNLMMQRDTNGDTVFERTWTLAKHVVNGQVPSTSSPTPVFLYGYRDTGGTYLTTSSLPATDLYKIISVQIHVITDVSTRHTPTYIDLVTTVRPRNAAGN
jgi:type II secretory pathway component PulJ